MIWLLATFHNGETMEYGIPLDEPIMAIERDYRHFSSLEILDIDHTWS